jgi:hypothetical protein
MPLRPPAGFIRPGFDPLKNPDAPTIGTATAGDQSASVAFTPPANVGGSAISQYQVLAYTGGTYLSNTAGTASPVNVTGLTNGTAYTFQVWALNTYGPGPFSAMSGSVTPNIGDRGLFGGGASGTVNIIDYVTITSLGNAIDFGDLYFATYYPAALASTTRGVFAGSAGISNVIQYVTIATTGNSTDFGDLNMNGRSTAGCSNTTRGLIGGSITQNIIDYITIATTGNASDFGDLVNQRGNLASCSSPTRGLFLGGTDSGTLRNIIDYVTIATTGNAIDFGDLLFACDNNYAMSSSTRGVVGLGIVAGNYSNVINYVTIASTGNAVDFGDVMGVINQMTGCSNAHGGL